MMVGIQEVAAAFPIILSLILIEGLLSVDNALAIAAMASHLPEKQQRLALRFGLIGAYVFRGICLGLAGWIMGNPWVKVFGALYLVYLMSSHLTEDENEEIQETKKPRGLWMTVLQIELMDLSLSVDNVVAAVALSPHLWVVCTGVFIGILMLRILAGYCIRLLQKFPIFARTAFVLVGFVGGILIWEMATGARFGHVAKFGSICGILILSWAYGRFSGFKALVSPLLRPAFLGMRLFSKLCEGIFWPLKVLHTAVRRVFRKRRAFPPIETEF
jgi:YkoY family integral membrane protein